MLSARTAWDRTVNEVTRRLAARRAAGAPILDLTASNPTQAGLRYPASAILGALAAPRALRYAPESRGPREAREAVAAYYAGRGVTVDPEHLVLTASTSEAYAHVFKLLADPGDTVLAPRPSYPLFDLLARGESVALGHYPLAYAHGWFLDLAALGEALRTTRSRAVLLVNPNNPTGSFLKRGEAEALLPLLAEAGAALVVDEVFADYAFADDPQRARGLHEVGGPGDPLVLHLSGLSKVAGLPQLKLGWIHVAGPPALRDEALARLELVNDSFLSASTPVLAGAAELLAAGVEVREQIRARVQGNLARLDAELAGSACVRLHVEGGWYAVLRVPATRSEEAWCLALLDEEGVLVHPGYFFDFEREGYLVVSLLPPPEVFAEGAARLLGCVARSG